VFPTQTLAVGRIYAIHVMWLKKKVYAGAFMGRIYAIHVMWLKKKVYAGAFMKYDFTEDLIN